MSRTLTPCLNLKYVFVQGRSRLGVSRLSEKGANIGRDFEVGSEKLAGKCVHGRSWEFLKWGESGDGVRRSPMVGWGGKLSENLLGRATELAQRATGCKWKNGFGKRNSVGGEKKCPGRYGRGAG